MNLPPLPLEGGALFIDNSSWVEGMSTCYRYLQYRSLNARVGSAEKPSLNFGSAIHLGLEYRYKTYKNQPVDAAYYNHMAQVYTTFFEQHPPPTDDWRTLNWAMELLRRYNDKYEIEPFNFLIDDKGQPLVELSFTLPIHTWKGSIDSEERIIPIMYSGRIDLPIYFEGNLYVMDHKTTSMLGDQHFNEMRMTAQQKGYMWAFEQLTGKKVHGYFINSIRTKEPPQYVLAGKPSKTGSKLTPEQWWSESLKRERFLQKEGELAEWKNNTIDLIEEFFWHYQRDYMPMKTKWCAMYGKCPYYDVCLLAPDDRGFMLASGQFTDNKWSPLNKTNPTQSKQ